MEFFCDKYFTRSRQVLEHAGLNPKVKYNIFMRKPGLSALGPMRCLIETFLEDKEHKLETLPHGHYATPGATLATLEGYIQDVIELETMYLQWTARPCNVAHNFRELTNKVPEKTLIDMHARHASGPEEVALISFGAMVGGCKLHSTDVGANAIAFLRDKARFYKEYKGYGLGMKFGVGTMPHALLAAFRGDYIKMCEAYLERFPDEKLTVLIDYNNKEIEDTLKILERFGERLGAVRIDTHGGVYSETHDTRYRDDSLAHMKYGDAHEYMKCKGVSIPAVQGLRKVLNTNHGRHVDLVVSSGFNKNKSEIFDQICGNDFQSIGTGSFAKFEAMATSDIVEVDGEPEFKAGRDPAYHLERFKERLDEFNQRPADMLRPL